MSPNTQSSNQSLRERIIDDILCVAILAGVVALLIFGSPSGANIPTASRESAEMNVENPSAVVDSVSDRAGGETPNTE